VAREAGNDLRTKQNARMMHSCIYDSLFGDAKARMASLEHHNDGPTLFFALVESTFTATFIHAQSLRHALQTLHPKRFNYDIDKLHAYIRVALQAIRAGSNGQPVSEPEILFYLFNSYKKIQAPATWASHVQVMQSLISRTPNYTSVDLMAEAARTYSQLRDLGEWKPSDKSPADQVMAMMATFSSNSGTRPTESGEKGAGNSGNKQGGSQNSGARQRFERPPFADKPGKLGDSKKWNDNVYYWCPGQHKAGHWVRHKPEKCHGGKGKAQSQQASSKKEVQVDPNRTTQAQAALPPDVQVTNTTDELLTMLANSRS
jgi:hypothetical protein